LSSRRGNPSFLSTDAFGIGIIALWGIARQSRGFRSGVENWNRIEGEIVATWRALRNLDGAFSSFGSARFPTLTLWESEF
jgi:hypothetical protein